MDNAELDVALEELESRLDRLRALYEQYFMGIERIEPQIPRKDVDRRIYVLRREKIRNTAKRFKLQTIISRYNTFQQYWQRICREIEAGTYKRHALKAERIAPGQFLTIAARKRLGRAVPQDDAPEANPSPAAAASAPAAASSLPPAAGKLSSLPPSVPRPTAATGAPTPKAIPPPKPGVPPKPGTRPPKPTDATPPNTAAKPAGSLELDMDFMGAWDPFAAAEKQAPAAPPNTAARPRVVPQLPPLRIGTSRPPAQATPAAITAGPKPQLDPVPKPIAKPTEKVATAPAPAKPAPSAPQPAPGPVIDERVRELHARLVEAKRQTKDDTAVSVEGLAKSLKATEAKLREQHKDRKIEFTVVIKDGKAVLKPTIR